MGTDLRTSEEPYSLRSEIGKSLALYLLYEVDETQQRFSDLRSFDMQTKQHPKSLALIRVKIQILGTLLKTGRETQRGNGDRPTDLRTSEEPYALRSEIGKSLALYLL